MKRREGGGLRGRHRVDAVARAVVEGSRPVERALAAAVEDAASRVSRLLLAHEAPGAARALRLASRKRVPDVLSREERALVLARVTKVLDAIVNDEARRGRASSS